MKSLKSAKILIIAYYFPPMGTIGFLRNYFISKSLAELFEKTFIVSIKNITIPSKVCIKIDFGALHRVFNFDYRNLLNLFSGRNKNIRGDINNVGLSKIVRFFRKSIDSFPLNTLIGEGGFFYIIAATIKGLKLIKQNEITHLYSSFRPLADHIIAFNIKLLHSDITWIADFRDLPVDSIRKNVFCAGFHSFIYKWIFSKADHVITVSEGLSDNLKDLTPNPIVVRNGIYGFFTPDKAEKYDKFTISYTGSLYLEYRNPAILLKALKQLMIDNLIDPTNFQIAYAGKDSLLWQKWIAEYEIGDISIAHGDLKMNDSISMQTKSHINLILSWAGEKQKGIVTGKFYEYLNTGSPIMCLINGSKDEEIENIYKELNAGRVFYNDETEILKKWILEFFSQWNRSGKIEFNYNQENLKNYSWDKKTEELKNIIFAN